MTWKEMVEQNVADPTERDALQEFFGVVRCGIHTGRALLLHGPGFGKTLTTMALRLLLEDQEKVACLPYEAAGLRGAGSNAPLCDTKDASFVIMNDIPVTCQNFAWLKTLLGDTVVARRPHAKECTTFVLPPLVIEAPTIPPAFLADASCMDRVVPIRFDTLPEIHVSSLWEEIKGQGAAIENWASEGFRRLEAQDRHFSTDRKAAA